MVDVLSRLDVELLRGFSRGERIQDTAVRLAYSAEWVKKRRGELVRRLDAATMAEAFTIALARGLYTEESLSGGQ